MILLRVSVNIHIGTLVEYVIVKNFSFLSTRLLQYYAKDKINFANYYLFQRSLDSNIFQETLIWFQLSSIKFVFCFYSQPNDD